MTFPSSDALRDSLPFVEVLPDTEMKDEQYPTVDFSTKCPVFERTGECKHGFKCRYLGGHTRKNDAGLLELITDEEKVARSASSETELNFIDPGTLKLLRTKKVRHPLIRGVFPSLAAYLVLSSHIGRLFKRAPNCRRRGES